MTIRAILFDLDGTLRYNDPPGREFFLDYGASIGLPIDDEIRRRVYQWEHAYWAESPDLLADAAAFPDNKSFWQHYSTRQLAVMGCTPAQAAELGPQFNAYMTEHYKPADLLFDDTYETLSALKARGYILGVVSNRDKPFGEYLAEKGIAGVVDFTLSGGEAGAKKPNPEILLRAAKMAGVEPAHSIYVGDNYHADVVGARAAGMRPILYDRHSIFDHADCEVITELKQLLEILPE